MSDQDLRENTYPHIATEFFTWLLYQSEVDEQRFSIEGIGEVEVLLQDRLSFQSGEQNSGKAVISGEDAPASAETKAALISGKLLTDIKLLLRLEVATYMLTLRGDLLDIGSLKQVNEDLDEPVEVFQEDDSKEAQLLLRMAEYEDIMTILRTLFRRFAERRTQDNWHYEEVQSMRRWVHEQ